jgi:hypothetical protein
MGELSYIDFSLYVNKVQSSISRSIEYKRQQMEQGKTIIS